MTDPNAPAAARYVGTRVHRVEDARLLTGGGTYVDDVTLPGLLHACFVRSDTLGADEPAGRDHPGSKAWRLTVP